jgi:hypothetical protein
MAVLGSILFNRTLKQFLDCKDPASKKGKGLAEKIRSLDPIRPAPWSKRPLSAIEVAAKKKEEP